MNGNVNVENIGNIESQFDSSSVVGNEQVVGELFPMSVSYADLYQYDNDSDECHYHNAATCPDCGQGMLQIGDQLACPGCGFANSGS